MRRFAAAVLAIPALLLAADGLAQSEDFDPPPPTEDYDPPPPPVSDPGPGPEVEQEPRSETRPRGKRDRRRHRNSTERDIAIGLGGLVLGEIIEEVTEEPRSRPRDCTYERAGGWMQPTQGVYLDDPHFDFINWGGANSPNPQLVQVNPWGVYDALLPMIAGRATALVGAIEYRDDRGNKTKTGDDRSTMVIKGRGNCTTLRPVKVRFTVTDVEGSRVVYETSQLPDLLPLEGPRKPDMDEFSVRVPAADGLPPLDAGAFVIRGQHGAPYSIKASIIRADTNTPTNLEVEVRGRVQTTQKMVVQFVPLMLTGIAPEYGQPDRLRAFTSELANESWRRIPDVYPILSGQFSPHTAETVAMGHLDPGQKIPVDPDFLSPERNPHPSRGPTPRQARLQSRLGDYLATRALLGAVDRIVAVVALDERTGAEFEWIVSAAGLAENSKVVFVPAPQGSTPPEVVDIVAHELIHTLPRYAFSSAQMEQQCGRDYHNTGRDIGLGLQLTAERRPTRVRHEGVSHLMGGHVRGTWWIEQCTYAHLIGALAVRPDPELWLVRAIISREGASARAELRPGYDLMGVSDVDEAQSGDWSVRLRDGAGRELAAWPFDPAWDAGGAPRNMMSVAMRVPALPQARRLEITHRGAIVAHRAIPARPPIIQSATADALAGGRKVQLRWTAGAEYSSPLLASVYVSTDGGQVFDNRLFELPITQAIVNVDPAAGEHVFKIVVTDGARSAERIVRIP